MFKIILAFYHSFRMQFDNEYVGDGDDDDDEEEEDDDDGDDNDDNDDE